MRSETWLMKVETDDSSGREFLSETTTADSAFPLDGALSGVETIAGAEFEVFPTTTYNK